MVDLLTIPLVRYSQIGWSDVPTMTAAVHSANLPLVINLSPFALTAFPYPFFGKCGLPL
jgi:hypothetical protein